MDRTERFYIIKQLLESRRVVPREVFLEKMEISLATFKRDIEYLRDRFNAPIVYDGHLKGYRLDEQSEGIQLPGVWFNAQEAYALLTMQQLLEDIAGGVINEKIAPLKARVEALLSEGGHAQEEVQKRVKILHLGQRPMQPQFFQMLCDAVLARHQVEVSHYHRERDEETRRRLSPLRVIYYRDNWYLDAWCHVRDALRCFSMAALRDVRVLSEKAIDVDDELLDKELGAGYGIFSGSDTQIARLKFSPLRSRWVAEEQWHPDQKGFFLDDGSYILEVPFTDSRELVMDVLKHGAEVEVLAPDSFRAILKSTLSQTIETYNM